MVKLNEKQLNFLYGGIAGVVCLIFFILTYMDWGTMEEIEKKIQVENGKIRDLQTKQAAINKAKKQLYISRNKFDTFKKLLPDDQYIIEFYDIMEKLRMEIGISEWQTIRITKNADIKSEFRDKDADKKKKKKPRRRSRSRRAGLSQDEYKMAFKGTFDQVGMLLQKIETFQRFFSVEDIRINGMRKDLGDDVLQGNIDLKVKSYSYTSQGASIDKQVDDFLAKFKPGERLKKQADEERNDLLKKRVLEQWKPITRNFFDKNSVIEYEVIEVENPDGEEEEKIEDPEPTEGRSLEEWQKDFSELQSLRNFLHVLALEGNWVELQVSLRKEGYERKLKTLERFIQGIKTKELADLKKLKPQLTEMKKELTEWKELIRKAEKEEKARLLVKTTSKDIALMKEKYNLGKKEGSLAILNEVEAIYSRIIVPLRDSIDMEPKFPKLREYRITAEKFYEKAENLKEIMKKVEVLNLQGIIFMKERPNYSVAFIGNKTVRANDELESGFSIAQIREGEVLLRYKEETLPIRLRRLKPVKKAG